MAPSEAPSAASRQSEFEQAVVHSLHLWPSLTLAVQSSWGGPDSSDKRDWFAGAVVDLFPPLTDVPKRAAAAHDDDEDDIDAEYVETVLLQVMLDEFEVNVDDDSSLEVAESIIRARAECAVGRFDEARRLRERFERLRGGKVEQLFQKADDEDQDTDWEDESGDDEEDGADVDMDEAPELVRREKQVPEVDEDGFTKVTRKKR